MIRFTLLKWRVEIAPAAVCSPTRGHVLTAGELQETIDGQHHLIEVLMQRCEEQRREIAAYRQPVVVQVPVEDDRFAWLELGK